MWTRIVSLALAIFSFIVLIMSFVNYITSQIPVDLRLTLVQNDILAAMCLALISIAIAQHAKEE